MKNFGTLFIEALTPEKETAVVADLSERYLKETDETDIQALVDVLKQEADKSKDIANPEGHLMIKDIDDRLAGKSIWGLFLIAPHHNDRANLLAPKELFKYPFPDFSDDVTVLSDLIWDMTLGSDAVDLHEEVTFKEEANELAAGDSEVSDHTFNDDWEDESSRRYHEPERNF